MICSIIAAFSQNKVIGNQGRIPWDLPEDRLHFKSLTTNHLIIFGRKSYEEIGHPLPNRTNIVISTTKQFSDKNLYSVKNLQEAFNLCKKLIETAAFTMNKEEIFICGGQRLYEEAIPYTTKLYLTEIETKTCGDSFFPEIEKDRFILESSSKSMEQNGLSFKFKNYSLIKPYLL